MTSLRMLAVLVGLAACGPAAPTPTTPATPAPPAASPARVLVNVDDEGVALGGLDPVAYVTDGAPVPGTAEHASQHGGATYWFAGAEHKATFDADPARYAPQYGGYCAYAAAQNRLSPSDPTAWMLHDGKLLVFTNAEFHDLFVQDPAGNRKQADANWPGLVARHGRPR